MRSSCILIIIFTVLVQPVYTIGQTQGSGFNIYAIADNYSTTSKKLLSRSAVFKDIKLIGGYMIDPYYKDVVDLRSVEKYLISLYPNPNSDGTVCIDLENKLFHNLETAPKVSLEFKRSVVEFKNIIRLVRKLRPNLKVGIYGLPFRVYYQSQIQKVEQGKLDELLYECDYIAPSLYVIYPDSERGKQANLNYFKSNLSIALEYGSRLDKPVIPFVWYAVHPSNKKFSRSLINKNEVLSHIDYIKSLKIKNKSIAGIIWYDGLTFSGSGRNNVKVDKNRVLLDYLGKYLNK